MLSALRNQGIGIRSTAVAIEAEFLKKLNSAQWDLVIYYENSRSLSVQEIFKLLKQSEREIPLIVICTESSSLDPLDILESGAKDVLNEADSERLLLSIIREVKNYRLIRKNLNLEISLRELEQRYQLLLEGAGDAIGYIHEGMHVYCNQSYASLFDYPDVKSITTTPLLDLVSEDDCAALKKLIGKPLQDEKKISIQGKRYDESLFSLDMIFTPVEYDGEHCLQLAVKPAAGNTAYAEQIDQIQTQDLLTRLHNKPHFMSKLEAAIADAVKQDSYSSLLVIRIDEFLDIESTIGKSSANLVLADISQFLQDSIDKSFAAGRLGSYEFGLILYDDNPEEALSLADFIKSKVNNRITSTSLPSLQLSCSIGIAAINGNALDAEDILARASSNLSVRSDSEMNKTTVKFEFSIGDSSSPDINAVISYINKALDKDLFKLLFQPIVSIKGKGSERYEVLIRMLDAEGNEIPPGEFIPVANLNGLGEKLDLWVVQKVMVLLKNIENPNTKLIINLTNNGLVSKTFLPWLSDELKRTRISTDQLVFQISEIDLQNNLDHTIEFCRGLEELNLKKTITHFGCALEPFQYLDEIKPNYVKLDKTLIRDIIYSDHQKNNVRSLIENLHQKDILVVAPQVEDMSILPVLWEIGTDFVQGYCLQGPSQEMNYEFNEEQEITLDAHHSR